MSEPGKLTVQRGLLPTLDLHVQGREETRRGCHTWESWVPPYVILRDGAWARLGGKTDWGKPGVGVASTRRDSETLRDTEVRRNRRSPM